MKAPRPGLPIILASLLALGAGGCGKRPAPEAVFLIVVDTLRSDRLSCYGCRTNDTPGIDRLAGMGVRFDRAHAAASWTVPSMGAVMTSRYPTQLGLVEKPVPPGRRLNRRDKRAQLYQTIPPRVGTLAETMRASGFRTGAFVNQPALFIGDGFRRGFDDWFFPASATRVRRYEPGEVASGSIPYLREAPRLDTELVSEFDVWMRAVAPGKTFAWIHLLTPHSPYSHPDGPGALRAGEPEPSRAELYDAEIRFVDELIGRVLDTIDETVGLERSSIVFTSDHGEAFGEHGQNEHGNSLHREVVQVPLLWTAPGLPAGGTVAGNVRGIDILPTVLDVTGIRAPETGAFEGVSLLPLIEGGRSSVSVFLEGMLFGGTERSLIEDGYKLMFDAQENKLSLYDLSWDPNEMIDLAAKQPERVRDLNERLTEVHERLLREYEAPEISPDEDQALEAMRALGYAAD